MAVLPETNLVRVFVSFPVSSVQAEKIKSIQLHNDSLKQIRWTPLPNLHVTIYFLGEVRKESLEQISNALSKAIKHTEAFRIEFEKITIEGKTNKQGMIWARFFKNNSFTNLNNNLYQAVESYLRIQSVLKDPIPHITIARFRKEAEIDTLDASFDATFSMPEINSCELWQTVHTKEGVAYKSLDRFDFKC